MGCNQKASYGALKGISTREDATTADSRARSRSPLVSKTSPFTDASTPVIVTIANVRHLGNICLFISLPIVMLVVLIYFPLGQRPNSLLSEEEDETAHEQEQEEEEVDEDTDGEAADEDDDLESGDSEDSKSRTDRQEGEEAKER